MKQRIGCFDLLKGIAIFLVVMGHALTMCIRGIDAAFIFKLIGQVHMPIFFFISGFLSFKNYNGSEFGFTAASLKKRFLQLIVPFVVMSALWHFYFPHSGLGSPMADSIAGLYCSFWKDGYWFTLCLFELFLIYWPLSAILRRLKALGARVAVVAAVEALLLTAAHLWASEPQNFDPAGITLLSWFFPIFMAGVFARKYASCYHTATTSGTWLTVASITFALTLYCIVYPWDLPFLPWWSHIVARPLLHVSTVIIAVAAVEPWSRREFPQPEASQHSPSAVARYFRLLGTESLPIYLLHYFFLFPLTPLQEPLRAMGLQLVPLAVVAAVTALCVTATTLLATHIIYRSPLLSLMLLGKNTPLAHA